SGGRASQQCLDFRRVERPKGPYRLERLLEYLHTVETRDDRRSRQVERVMQAFDRRDGPGTQQDAVGPAFHSEDRNVVANQLRQHQLLKAAEMRIHHVQRHLYGVEPKAALGGDSQHVEVDPRVLVPGKSKIAELAGLAGRQKCAMCAFLVEDAIGIFKAQDLVVLYEIDTVDAKAAQRLVQLL